jgi:pilus assembly protein CpaC
MIDAPFGLWTKMRKGRPLALVFWSTICASQLVHAAPPVPPAVAGKIDRTISRVSEPEGELALLQGRSKVLTFRRPVVRVSIADPSIVEFVAYGEEEAEFIGNSFGTTSVSIWTGEGEDIQILSFLVTVEADQAPTSRRNLELKKLERQVNLVFPNSTVRLYPMADKVIVKGQARDAEEANAILAVLRRGGSQGGGGVGGGGAGSVTSDATVARTPDDQRTHDDPQQTRFDNEQIINLLRVPGEQQVMLKVKIAELKRATARDIGANVDAQFKDFIWGSALAGTPNTYISGTFDKNRFNVFLDALESQKVAKILAQPTLTTLSGRTANFLSGGEFAVPTVVGVSGAQAASTTFRGYGTMLNFTPTVLDKDRIRLQVNPQFSTLNPATSVNGIFGLDTRSASTVVELREGQVLAIAGLTQSQHTGGKARIPFIGEWPVVGSLFNRRTTSADEVELLVIVSPEIVHAMEPNQAPSILPGMEVTEPTDFDYYVRNRIEGRPGHHHRTTVFDNYRDRLLHPQLYFNSFENSANYFMTGKIGFSQ